MYEYDCNLKGSLSYYATLLSDPTTGITMNAWDDHGDVYLWEFVISTPEDARKHRAWGNWSVK